AGAADLPRWLHDYVASDGRVTLTEETPDSGYPSPVTARVSAGLALDRSSITRALDELRAGGGVRAEAAPGRHLTVETTRSVLRRTHSTQAGVPAGPRPVSAESLAVATAVHHVTPQGMI